MGGALAARIVRPGSASVATAVRNHCNSFRTVLCGHLDSVILLFWLRVSFAGKMPLPAEGAFVALSRVAGEEVENANTDAELRRVLISWGRVVHELQAVYGLGTRLSLLLAEVVVAKAQRRLRRTTSDGEL